MYNVWSARMKEKVECIIMKVKIIIYTLFVMVFLYMVEQVLYTPYLIKTLIKIPLFLLLPMALYKYDFKIKWSMRLYKADVPVIAFWSGMVFIAVSYTHLTLPTNREV